MIGLFFFGSVFPLVQATENSEADSAIGALLLDEKLMIDSSSDAGLESTDNSNITDGEPELPINSKSDDPLEVKNVVSVAEEAVPFVSYRTHLQDFGWQGAVRDREISGSVGQAKRLEAVEISLGNTPMAGGVDYQVHLQNYGWMSTVSDGRSAGTTGEGLRLEAIKINLTGEMMSHYDIYYRVHAQNFGWLDWAKNGEPSGTAGYTYRLEALEVLLVKKGADAPGETVRPFVKYPKLSYQTHIQNIGWQNYVSSGALSGTTGEGKRLEGIKINLADSTFTGSISYRTHVQDYGWQSWKQDDAFSGTEGESKRLEAIQINLNGEIAEYFDVYYRVHAQNFGWLDWAKNGESAGTEGLGFRLEAIELRLVKKGGPTPGKTSTPFVKLGGIAAQIVSANQSNATKVQLKTQLSYGTMVNGVRVAAPISKISAYMQSTTSDHKVNLSVSTTNNPLIFNLGFDEKMLNLSETYEIIASVAGSSSKLWTGGINQNTILGKISSNSNYAFYKRDPTPVNQLTLKHLLQTALEPVGSTLYVWGGGWNEADTGSGIETVTMGVSPQWKSFFKQYGSTYDYTKTMYQIHNGLDCSGYVGWTIYNSVNTTNNKNGYVMLADRMTSNFASRGWGTYKDKAQISQYRPGDILSSAGHVYMVLGVAADKSLVVVHSTPKGVQINGTPTPSGITNSIAASLAKQYMSTYYPDWYNKFPSVKVDYSYLTDFDQMSWNISGNALLSDPDGIVNKSAEQVLASIFSK